MISVIPAALLILVVAATQANAKTGAEFLEVAPAPIFKEGHTLLPLTRWAWPLNYEMNVELAKRWGYALDIYPGKTGEELYKPTSLASRLVAFNKAHGDRYPVAVNTRRVMFESDVTRDLLSANAWLRDSDGALVLRAGQPVLKPYISDGDAAAMGRAEIPRLQELRDMGVTVSIVLNGAEYMPAVPGHEKTYWQRDPEVEAWLRSLSALPAADQVAAFAEGKAMQEQAIRDAVHSVMPKAEVVYYVTGDVRKGLVNELQRLQWAWPYRFMIRGGTIPSWEFYYGYYGFWVPTTTTTDYLLLHATNGAAQAIQGGRPLSYNWLSAGWSLTRPQYVSDDMTYMGFLKFLYTLGSVGNVAGYFTFPPGGFNGDLGDVPPDWLRQIMLLSHAHAAFSHLEDFLRDGDLLPGDGNHAYSRDLYGKPTWAHPAYEFATTDSSRFVRVVARRLREKQEWLVTVWAVTGEAREVSVSIPDLGELTVLARGQGSLYLAKPGSRPKLLDPAGMDPSRNIAELLAAARQMRPNPRGTLEVR